MTTPQIFITAAATSILLLFCGTSVFAEDLDARILSLDISAEVTREGTIEVEHKIKLQVDGETIKRGPCLNFLTVFKGPGGLVLDNQMKILEVVRDGTQEAYHETGGVGYRSLYCGSSSVALDPGVYEYVVRYSAQGDWIFREGNAYGGFDMTGPFSGLAIDQLQTRLRLPEGNEATRFFSTVTGNIGDGRGYTSRQDGRDLFLETTQKLDSKHAVFLDVAWSAADFATQNRWLLVMQQHPRLPISVFVGAMLLWALVLMLKRLVAKK